MSAALLTVSGTIVADAHGLDRLHKALDVFWARLNAAKPCKVSGDWTQQFTLALIEVVSNIARHGSHDIEAAHQRIEVRLIATGSGVRAELHHAGRPFTGDLTVSHREEPSDPLDMHENGRGIWMIRQAVDTLQYARMPDSRNRWTLEKAYDDS